MNKLLTIFTAIYLTLTVHHSSAQSSWTRILGDEGDHLAFSLAETYDKGYIIGGHLIPQDPPGGLIKDGIIYKTDINGEILWKKTIGGGENDQIGGIQALPTYDGGIIAIGGTYNYGSLASVFILKLNTCGEREWCKSFVDNDNSQFAIDILQATDNSYWFLVSYWGNDIMNERIWIFRISTDGDILWQNVYGDWSPSNNGEDANQLIRDNTNGYLITGRYYEAQPGYDSTIRYVRPMFIRLDSIGNEDWHTLYGIDEFFSGHNASSVINSKGDIYSVGKNRSIYLDGDKPVLHKLDPMGGQLYHHNIVEDSKIGGASTISILEDSILFIGSAVRDFEDSMHVFIHKTDTLGNIISQKEVLQTSNTFVNSLITHDNKFVIVGSFYFDNDWDIYLYKFNRDLEYDSIYTQPFTYDSLCPYQIVSDTISLDTTTVNLDELYNQMHEMKVFPNPTSSEINIELGELIKGTHIRLYNGKGDIVVNIPISEYERNYIIDVNNLSSGLYVVALMNKNLMVDRKKVVIE